jgi:hypothetical protein
MSFMRPSTRLQSPGGVQLVVALGSAFLSENASAMKKPMAGMGIKPSGDVEL